MISKMLNHWSSDAGKFMAVIVVFLSTTRSLGDQKSFTNTSPRASAEQTEIGTTWQVAFEVEYLPIKRSKTDLSNWAQRSLKRFKERLAIDAIVPVFSLSLHAILREISSRPSARLCDQARHERSRVLLV